MICCHWKEWQILVIVMLLFTIMNWKSTWTSQCVCFKVSLGSYSCVMEDIDIDYSLHKSNANFSFNVNHQRNSREVIFMIASSYFIWFISLSLESFMRSRLHMWQMVLKRSWKGHTKLNIYIFFIFFSSTILIWMHAVEGHPKLLLFQFYVQEHYTVAIN